MPEPVPNSWGATAQLGERRQVSVLFADMVGYTAIMEGLDEGAGFEFVQSVYARLADCVREHDGSVHAFGGDSIMAVFGLSERSEQAAVQACHAALAIQKAFASAADEIEARFGARPSVRVGISSGVAVVAAVDSDSATPTTIGSTVNLASRIEGVAPPGECLMCSKTHQLVEWQTTTEFHGESTVKGVAEPQQLWRLVAVHENANRFEASLGRGLSPLLGRDSDMAALRAALGEVGERRQVVDLVGEPGLGKTRLIYEFLASIPSAGVDVLQGHCTADGRQSAFMPFLEVTRSAFRIAPEDSEAEIARKLQDGLESFSLNSPLRLGLLMNLLGLEPPAGSLDGLDGLLIGLRTRRLLQKLLSRQCARSATVLVIEDAHWIDRTSEELLASLIADGPEQNLLILVAYRPEYSPPWADYPTLVTQRLKPLEPEDVVSVAKARLGTDNLPENLTRQIAERGNGNPLFQEEILHFLVEQGALRVTDGAVSFDEPSGESVMPASLLGLLAARLDRLSVEDREVLHTAAVIGRRFDTGLLSRIIPADVPVENVLGRLADQEIIERVPGTASNRFRHVLMRDCVYQSLLPQVRSDLHLAVAEGIEQRSGDRVTEVVEELAQHYQQTSRKDRAFASLALAGAKSLGISAHAEARDYFAAALELYEADPACAAPDAFMAMLADYALTLNVSLEAETLIDLVGRSAATLDRIGDSRDYVLLLHHYVSCLICNARFADALSAQRKASAMAARLNDRKAEAYAMVSELSVSTYYAPMTIAGFQAKRREAEPAVAEVREPYLSNFFLATVAWDEVCRGRVERALEASDRLVEVGLALSDPRALGYGTAMRALIASIADNYDEALELAERALEISRARFEGAIASAARCGSVVVLRRPGAVEQVLDHLALCERKGWTMFAYGPRLMLGVAEVMDGRIGSGFAAIEETIRQSERDGFQANADWGRLYLCELYLAILSGEGEASARTLLRNARALFHVFTKGPARIAAMIEQIKANPQFDLDGHNIGRAEMILGLLAKSRKRPDEARRHLLEAQRIIGASGESPLLTRIETAMVELG